MSTQGHSSYYEATHCENEASCYRKEFHSRETNVVGGDLHQES